VASHKSTGKGEVKEKKTSFLLEDVCLFFKAALGECLFACKQERMIKKMGDSVLFFCCLPGPKNKRKIHKNMKGQEEKVLAK